MRDQGELIAVVSRKNRRIVYKAWVEGSLLVLQKGLLSHPTGGEERMSTESSLFRLDNISLITTWLLAYGY